MNPHHPSLSLGTWLSIGSPVIAELAALTGFDWVLFDLEHGCVSEATLSDQLRAIRGTATKGIVRVAAPAPDQIARVLDWGADGIMVPRVECAAAAESIVRFACHAPLGRRGFSRTVRATDYGLKDHPDKPLIMVQIESLAGVGDAANIAAVEGVDVLFVGPADLRHDLANNPFGESPAYEDCLDQVLAAVGAAGKEAGILVRDPAEVAAHAARGFTRIAVDSDLSILRKAYQHLVSEKP
jgi:2-dehydro-3-deoxyglucarate aldolase/4-hydroxy-2-oxoheptanedioate aldolase